MIEDSKIYYFKDKGSGRVVLFYILLIAVLYAPVVFTGKTLLPGNYYPHGVVENWPHGYEGRTHKHTLSIDLATPAYYEFPVNKLVGDELKEGRMPLWNPFQGAGTPLAAQYSTRALFPYQMLEDVSPVWAWDFFLLGRLLIAGLFTFLFLRGFGLRFTSSFLGGAFYMFSGSFTWFINLEQMANVAMVAPVLLLCMQVLARRGELRDVGFSAVAFSMVLVAGQPETALYTLLLGLVYYLLSILLLPSSPGGSGAAKALGKLAAAFVIGFTLSLPLLLPFIELWANAHHIHPVGGDMGVRDTNDIERVVGILTPTLNELPLNPTYSHHPLAEATDTLGNPHFSKIFPNNGEWDYLGGYSGMTMAFLALSGLFLTFFKGRSRFKEFQILFFSFAMFVVLKNFGVRPFLWLGYLPFFDQVWSQRWAGPTWVLSLSIAAALGLQGIIDYVSGKFSEARGGWERLGTFYEKEKGFLWGVVVHGFAIWVALVSAKFFFALYVAQSTGEPLSALREFAISSFFLPTLVLVLLSFIYLHRRAERSESMLSPRRYAYLFTFSLVTINALVLLLASSGMIESDSDVYVGGSEVHIVISAAYAFFALYLFLWRCVLRFNERYKQPYSVFTSAAVLILALYFVGVANLWTTPMKLPYIRPYYAVSVLTGEAVSVFLVLALFAVCLYYIKFKNGIHALTGLALLELWYAIPRGYEHIYLFYKLIPFAVGLASIVVFIAGWRRLAYAGVALFFLAFLWLDSSSPYGFPDRYDPFTESPYVEFLKEEEGHYRVVGTYGTLFPNYASSVGLQDIRFINSLAIGSTQDFRIEHLHTLRVSRLTSASLWFTGRPELHVEEVGGWATSTEAGFQVALEGDETATGEPSVVNEEVLPEKDILENRKFYSFLGVKYIVSPASRDLALEGFPVIYDSEVKIYENPEVLPRAFVVHEVKVASDYASIPPLLDDPDFDLAKTVVIETELAQWAGGLASTSIEAGGSLGALGEGARIREYSSDRVVVDVRAVKPGILVLTDAFYPGWKARVDDEEREILRVNGVVRGVYIEAGEENVEFIYAPLSFRLGALVSTGASLFVIYSVVVHRRRMPPASG